MNLEAEGTRSTAGALMERQAVPRSTMVPPSNQLNAHSKRRRAKPWQSFFQSVKSALQAIRANKLRSLLTSLGIIIGVGAVIMVVSISESNTAAINQSLSSLNPDELTIRAGSTNTGGVRQGQGSRHSLKQYE